MGRGRGSTRLDGACYFEGIDSEDKMKHRLMTYSIAAGALASIPLERLMRSMLYGVAPGDPLTFGAVVVVLCVVACTATYIPASRASRVDPMRALRHE